MYANPRAKVILQDLETDFFDCPMGVKQGDSISATLFSIFINDLAVEIKDSKVGINLFDSSMFPNDSSMFSNDSSMFVNVLLYADDIVLLTSNEDDLQFLLSIVENWCRKWRLEVNLTKTNVMHIRNVRRNQSNFVFLFNNRVVNYCKTYKYLGCTLDEFLNYNLTSEAQAEVAGRALGALITKTIKNGGFPYKIYSMLFDCTVSSISDYGAEIWGFEAREAINKIQLRAARSFLGLPQNATSVGVLSEINWPEPVYRAQVRMVRHYFRIIAMENSRLTKKIYFWDKSFSEQNNVQTWSSEIDLILSSHNLDHCLNLDHVSCSQPVISQLKESMFLKQTVDIKTRCIEKPKLRTYVTFNEFGVTPSYVTKPMSFLLRKFVALTRLSNLSIRLETGRFERPRLIEQHRLCLVCQDRVSVEDEFHFIFKCVKYTELRKSWFSKIITPENFNELVPKEKLKIVLNEAVNVKLTAQFIVDAYNLRSKFVTK